MADAGITASGGDGYALCPNLLVIADDPARAQLAEEAAGCAGLRVTGRADIGGAAEALGRIAIVDAVAIEAAGVSDERLEELLARIHDFAEGARIGVVAVAEPHQLDLVAGALLGPGRQILCQPGAGERTLAMMLAARAPDARLSDVTRDADRARLQRLHEEVARIADTLARMTRGEEAPQTSGPVRAPGLDYRGPETDEVRVTSAELRSVLRARRMRAQFFDGELFADPAWDMLLDLFAADIERRRVSVSSLCIAAAVPPTTALRWIGTLHDAGLFERQPDPADRRRAYIALSAKGLEGMRGFTGALKRAGLHLI